MPLTLEFGYASETGPRGQNEDYGGYVTPDATLAATKGVLAVVADGVPGLMDASQYTTVPVGAEGGPRTSAIV